MYKITIVRIEEQTKTSRKHVVVGQHVEIREDVHNKINSLLKDREGVTLNLAACDDYDYRDIQETVKVETTMYEQVFEDAQFDVRRAVQKLLDLY